MTMHVRFRTALWPRLLRWLRLRHKSPDAPSPCTFEPLTTFVYQAGEPLPAGTSVLPGISVSYDSSTLSYSYLSPRPLASE